MEGDLKKMDRSIKKIGHSKVLILFTVFDV
jgi:hypothetical protein